MGDKSIELLMSKFRSVKRLRMASKSDIAREVGESKAGKIYDFLNFDF